MKILIFGDRTEDFSSYSIMTKSFVDIFKEHELYLIALSSNNIITNEDHTELPVIRNCGGRETPSTEFTFTDNLYLYSKLIKPDLVFVHVDTNTLIDDVEALNDFAKLNIPYVLYAVIDGFPIPKRDIRFYNWINKHGRVITFSKFAHNLIDSEYIPHTIDLDFFKPMNLKKEKLTIGCVATCTERKSPYMLMKTYKRLKDKYGDEIQFIYHSRNITPLIANFITENKLKIIDTSKIPMNEIYNLIDIFVLPTRGEAFGLPLLEAQACGVPVVTTDYTTGPELVKGHGELVSGTAKTYCNLCGVPRLIPDEEELFNKVCKLIDNPSLRERYSKESLIFAKDYDTNKWKADWLKIISSISDK